MKLPSSHDGSPTTLCTKTIARRRPPVNISQSDMAIFSHELEKIIPETTLLELNDVRVSSDGILFSRLHLLPESFAFPAHLQLWKRRSVLKFFVTNYARRRSRAIAQPVLWVTDDWSRGYFHWLTDVLSRLFVMRDWMDDLVLLLPWGYQSLDFVQASLPALGVKAVEFVGKDEVLRCRRLFLPTHTAPSGHYNEGIIRGVRELLLNGCGAYGDAGYREENERVYISRGRAPKRRIVNEKTLSNIFTEFGFKTIYAEDLSFEEQVRTLSRARYLVSNHGAGLTNMLFMPSGSSVLELRHHTDCINNCYFTLASALDLNYFYQTCLPGNLAQDPHAADLLINPDLLRANLTLMLGSESTTG